jgi:LPXTG-motif cell wall-anchored protein
MVCLERSANAAEYSQRDATMPQFMQETWFMVLMGVLLVALVILLIYMRNKQSSDD